MTIIRKIWLVAVVASVAAIVFTCQANAQSTFYESEPNNSPDVANPVNGEITIVGNLGGQDQDAFMWSVSDVQAQKRWTFELEGMPGTPTIAEVNQVDFAENGIDVISKKKLFRIGSQNGLKPGLIEDILFEPGDYLIGVASAGSEHGSYRMHIRKGSKITVNSRTPNNPDQASAYKLKPGSEYASFIETSDSWFQFEIKDSQDSRPWAANVQIPVGQTSRLLVLDNAGQTLSSTTVDTQGRLRSDDLDLTQGKYYLQIASETDALITAVKVLEIGQAIESTETSSQDNPGAEKPIKRSWKLAKRFDPHQGVSDHFGSKREYHYFSFDLDDITTENILSLHVETDISRKIKLCLLNSKGAAVQCRSNKGTVNLPDLVLSPGTWGIMADSSAPEPSSYTITLQSGPPAQINSEAEPNDNVRQATGITTSEPVNGRFASREEDYFRVIVSGESQLWSINAEGDKIYELRYHDGAGVQSQKANPEKGQRQVQLQNIFMMPGQHFVSIKGDADSEYRLSLRPLGPPDPNSEREPNSDTSRAETLQPGQERYGLLDHSDLDYYRFSVSNNGYFRLSIVPPADGKIRTYLDYGTTQFASLLTNGEQTEFIQGMFSPGEYQVRLRPLPAGNSPYHIKLEQMPRFSCVNDCEPIHTRKLQFLEETKPLITPVKLPVDIALLTETGVVAAYQPFGQRVPATLRITNKSNEAKSLNLETAVSDYRWAVELNDDSVSIEAGQSLELTLQIQVPRDAWTNQPVTISARVFEETGSQSETSAVIDVDGHAEGVNPYQAWDLPETMLGGINAASSVLGGQRVVMPGEKDDSTVPGIGHYFDQYFDGRVRQTVGGVIRSNRNIEPVSVSVKLAGDAPVDVAGIILNPVGREAPVNYLADFELLLSMDGEHYQSALKDRLKPLAIDQPFALDKTVTARYARLQLLNSHAGKSKGSIGLGEWKVVARPGVDLSAGEGFNVANPKLGGQIAWSRPTTWRNWETDLLTESSDHHPFRLKPGLVQEWAIGFHHQRAARIYRLQWVDSERAKPQERVKKVQLSVATSSPVGPWVSIGEWDRSVSPDEYILDSPVWARYVRFQITGTEQSTRLYAPATIRVFEQASDDGYSSILGEWGERSAQAAYEKLQGLNLDSERYLASGNNSRDQATVLAFDQAVSSRVILGEEEDWYKLTVPEGSNTIYLTQSGAPTLRTLVHMENQAGEPVRLTNAGRKINSTKLKAVVEPGKMYWIKVEEPPRAVVFAFDNSGSVRPFSTSIYRALNAYAGDLVPGRDEARIIPFGGEFLTRDWVGEPFIQQRVLNDYARNTDSSAAESTLLIASNALSSKPGVKAVVIVTDAATPRDVDLWGALQKVRPRVFTMRVGNSDSTGLYEDLMQSWSMVNEGYYSYMSTQAEMDKAFDRAATMLRQPAGYSLEATAVFERAPGPGKLKLVSGDEKGLGGAVELILDASGSMLKRMEGGRRIEIAKKLLSKAVTGHIPAGTQVALRVFGHKEANSCRTDLVIPMQALDPATVEKTLSGINAMNLAKTPIADSLAMVESDLKDATGPRLVILVTDGEETCDGDPAKVLASLSEKGIDLRLEIVGFAIDNDVLKQQFESWAKQGGGRYFDADNASSLEHSLTEALQVPYEVLDQSGTPVARGTIDGKGIELKAGLYKVNIATSPPITIDKIEIPGEQEVIVPVKRQDDQ